MYVAEWSGFIMPALKIILFPSDNQDGHFSADWDFFSIFFYFFQRMALKPILHQFAKPLVLGWFQYFARVTPKASISHYR